MKKFYVWGNSPASSELIRNAESSHDAARAAIAQGFTWESDSWAIEVEATEEELDVATRFDRAVASYCEATEIGPYRLIASQDWDRNPPGWSDAPYFLVLDGVAVWGVEKGVGIERAISEFESEMEAAGWEK